MKRLSVLIVAVSLVTLESTIAAPPPETQYEWLRSARIFLLDAYNYPLFPTIDFDAEKLAETLADMHFNTVRIPTSGWYYMIPGTQFETARDLGGRDILAESIAACKPRGIKVVAYVRTGGPVAAEIMNPDWTIKGPHGEVHTRWLMGCETSAFCWNTPYRQAFLELVEKLSGQYDIDGIYFDAWGVYLPSLCYCDGCKTGFKQATQYDIPYRADKAYTPEELKIIEAYSQWYIAELTAVFNTTKSLIKSRKDIPLITNIGHVSRLEKTGKRSWIDCDAYLYEMSKDLLDRVEGISLAISRGLVVWPYVGWYDGIQRVIHNGDDFGQQIYATAAFGGAPIPAQGYFYVNQREGREPVRNAFRLLDEQRQYIENFRPDKFCAVVWNDADPPGHAVDEWLWDTNARYCTSGAFKACLDNHIQATSLLKECLEDAGLLGQYKVLYLSDICYVSPRQADAIKQFVHDGGGLVMTYATSLYDEAGIRRQDFSLGDLARVASVPPAQAIIDEPRRHQSWGGVWDVYLRAKAGQTVLQSPLADDLIPAHLFETVRPLPRGTVAADIVIGGAKPAAPGLIVSQYGKGRVAYIPAALDAAYLQTNIPQYADFLKDVIRYVSPNGLPYDIDGPSSLLANMTVNGTTRVLHLINGTGLSNTKFWHTVDYLPPIENVTVRVKIPEGTTVRNIRLFVPAEHTRRAEVGVMTITLPRIEAYQGIAIELE